MQLPLYSILALSFGVGVVFQGLRVHTVATSDIYQINLLQQRYRMLTALDTPFNCPPSQLQMWGEQGCGYDEHLRRWEKFCTNIFAAVRYRILPPKSLDVCRKLLPDGTATYRLFDFTSPTPECKKHWETLTQEKECSLQYYAGNLWFISGHETDPLYLDGINPTVLNSPKCQINYDCVDTYLNRYFYHAWLPVKHVCVATTWNFYKKASFSEEETATLFKTHWIKEAKLTQEAWDECFEVNPLNDQWKFKSELHAVALKCISYQSDLLPLSLGIHTHAYSDFSTKMKLYALEWDECFFPTYDFDFEFDAIPPFK